MSELSNFLVECCEKEQTVALNSLDLQNSVATRRTICTCLSTLYATWYPLHRPYTTTVVSRFCARWYRQLICPTTILLVLLQLLLLRYFCNAATTACYYQHNYGYCYYCTAVLLLQILLLCRFYYKFDCRYCIYMLFIAIAPTATTTTVAAVCITPPPRNAPQFLRILLPLRPPLLPPQPTPATIEVALFVCNGL